MRLLRTVPILLFHLHRLLWPVCFACSGVGHFHLYRRRCDEVRVCVPVCGSLVSWLVALFPCLSFFLALPLSLRVQCATPLAGGLAGRQDCLLCVTVLNVTGRSVARAVSVV
jgi:hypothetical protein